VDPEPLMPSHPKEKCDSISFALDKIIAQCTAFELPDRIQSAKELRQLLKELGETS
jgi:hypothetical protein